MLKLLVTNRATGEKRQYNLSQNAVTFGRQADCDVVLDSSAISRRHAQIVTTRQLIELEDLGSGNGTFLNQERLRPKERNPLKTGDKIRIEEFEIDVEIDQPRPPRSESKVDITDPDIIEIKMIKKVLGALDQDKQAGIFVVGEPFANKKAIFEDGQEELAIGRDADCQLQLDAAVVSRKHAIISAKWGGYAITDMGSKNGTFVNGERITEKMLKNGDEIVIGTIKAYFKNPHELDIDALSKSIVDAKEHTRPIPADIARTAANQQQKEADVFHVATDNDIAKQPKEEAAPKAEDKKAQPEAKLKDDLADLAAAEAPAKATKPKRAGKNPLTALFTTLLTRFSTLELTLLSIGVAIFAFTLIMLILLFV